MQHEVEPLGRRQRVEHDLQREPDGIGQEHFMLRIEPAVGGHDQVRHVHAGRGFGTRLARLKCVQTHEGDDCREPPAQIFDPSAPERLTRSHES